MSFWQFVFVIGVAIASGLFWYREVFTAFGGSALWYSFYLCMKIKRNKFYQ